MNKENENTKVTEANLSFLMDEFTQTDKPLSLQSLAKKLAYKKTASQLSQAVKKYDPRCAYEVSDLIHKEYNEPLQVSSKGAEPFQGAVVLRIIKKIKYEDFNSEMLEVDYTGGGTFRKHIDYMKKTKTQVLLPSNIDAQDHTPEILKKEKDPRLNELPMTDKDLKKLEKSLQTALAKSDIFFNWNDYWQIKEKQVKIPEGQIKKIEKHFQQTQQSTETTDLVTRFFDCKPSDAPFDLTCLSLNSTLERNYKKNFLLVSPENWGKWFLKKALDSFLENLPLSAPKAKLPPFEEEKKKETVQTQGFPLKIYLTWREILSGGIKIPKSLKKEFSGAREYTFTDIEGEKDHSVYYYPNSQILVGLREFYENNNVPQGASLTLEKKEPFHFSFGLKKAKKKLSVSEIIYDPVNDKFAESGKEVFTFSLPNKIIHLDRETLSKLFSLYSKRDPLDLRELLILIFKNFGLKGEGLSLHYLRAFHLVDMLKQTTQEDVEKTLLDSPEFAKSEKKKGLFFYKEKIKSEEEIGLEEAAEIPPESQMEEEDKETIEEVLPEIGTVGEISAVGELEVIGEEEELEKEIRIEPLPLAREKFEIEPKEEKEPRRKKHKMKIDVEPEPRRRKREKKIIEEKIEIEESEFEALIATKAKEKKEAEEDREGVRAKEKKEDYKPFVSEEPKFGIFADKLKSALTKKKPEKKKIDEKSAKDKPKKEET